MITFKTKTASAVLLAASASTFAMEPDQRALELALSLTNSAPQAPLSAKSGVPVSVSASAAARGAGEAAGVKSEADRSKEVK